MKANIYIEVRGGAVTAVYADAHRDVEVNVNVLDYDVLERGDFIFNEEEVLEDLQRLEAEVKGLPEIY